MTAPSDRPTVVTSGEFDAFRQDVLRRLAALEGSKPQPTPTPAPEPTPTKPLPIVIGSRQIVATRAHLAARPTSGAAWAGLLADSKNRSTKVDLVNQDNQHAAFVFAAALVAARAGDAAAREHVVGQLQQLPAAPIAGARVLAISRQLAGYAMAADLIGHRDPAFEAWLGGMRTKNIGNHGRWDVLAATSEDSGSNWGAWAMASRAAISAYLGDTTDLARCAKVMRGFLGDRTAHAFRPTNDFDPAWTCAPSAWVPINPPCSTAKDGAIVEDIARSAGAYPAIDGTGLMYSWETLGGLIVTARVLAHAGYPDVYDWSDRALLRAAQFLHRNGGYPPKYGVSQHIGHEINAVYGVKLGPLAATAGHGRQYGYGDWLGH